MFLRSGGGREGDLVKNSFNHGLSACPGDIHRAQLSSAPRLSPHTRGQTILLLTFSLCTSLSIQLRDKCHLLGYFHMIKRQIIKLRRVKIHFVIITIKSSTLARLITNAKLKTEPTQPTIFWAI